MELNSLYNMLFKHIINISEISIIFIWRFKLLGGKYNIRCIHLYITVSSFSNVFENDTEEKVRKMGAQGYIVKSDFERENLIQKAREILNG